MAVKIKQSPLIRRKTGGNLNIVPCEEAETTMGVTFKHDLKKVKNKPHLHSDSEIQSQNYLDI